MENRRQIEERRRYWGWKSKRRQKLARKLLLPVVAAALAVLLYSVIASHYYKVFLPGTSINGTDVAGMTQAEAEQALIEAAENDYTLTLVFRGGGTETVRGSAIDLEVSFTDEIGNALDAQKRFTWLPRLLGRGSQKLDAAGLRIYDMAKLTEWLSGLDELQEENTTAPTDACMRFDDTGHLEVKAEEQGNRLVKSRVADAVENAVAAGRSELELEQVKGAYEEASITKENSVLLEQIEKTNRYLNTSVTYRMHDDSEVTVDASVIKDWLAENPDHAGWYYLDQQTLMDGITDYVASLAADYDYSYGYYDFTSTNQGVVSLPVNEGSFGYIIDQSGEADALFADVVGCQVETRVPVYRVATPLEDGVGGTYLEVDTILQKVYLYQGGTLSFTTDCVTGLASDPNRVTPSGVYALYSKETNRTLQGTVEEDTGQPEYSAGVNYWMPFYGGYGFHDASWRTAFGGSIYQTNGSHGCVNLPVMAAATIYDAVEVGTPVIII